MKHLILLFIALTIQLSGQGLSDYFYRLEVEKTENAKLLTHRTLCPDVETELLKLLEQYEQECYEDTIKAQKFQDLPSGEAFDYVIWHENYGEWVSEKQLEERGYKYKYRWVIETDPFEFEYIFLKEPTLKGFIDFLKRKEGR